MLAVGRETAICGCGGVGSGDGRGENGLLGAGCGGAVGGVFGIGGRELEGWKGGGGWAAGSEGLRRFHGERVEEEVSEELR